MGSLSQFRRPHQPGIKKPQPGQHHNLLQKCRQKSLSCISTTTCELALSVPDSLWLTGLSLTPSLTARPSSDVPSPKPKQQENFPSASCPSSLLMTRSSPSPGPSTGLWPRK